MSYGVYYTSNQGNNWIAANEGLFQWPDIADLGVNSNYIFAGTYGHGVYRRLLSEIIGVKKISEFVPQSFSLFQNYPNPFNPVTRIKFSLPFPSKGGVYSAQLVIYDMLGRKVAQLIPPLRGGQEGLPAGSYEVEWDASNYPSGVYFYKLTARDASAPLSITKKMILIK